MSKSGKTLVILSPGFPKDEMDATCLPFLQQFILELKIQVPGLQLMVLAFDYPLVRSGYHWNTIRVFSFNGWKKGRIAKLYTWWLVLRKMRKIRRENDVIGILSLWYGPCAFVGNRFAKRNRLKHFCWIQGQDAKKGNRYVPLTKLSSCELIAISDFTQSDFEKNYGIKPGSVIPAGINRAVFNVPGQIRSIDILGVGSLIPLKQYSLFVEILSLVKRYKPDVHAVLCGKGPEESALKVLICQYDLQDNIVLTGELPHEEVLEYMSKSKIFLHTSSYEGICVSCIEALYAGSHVLSFVQLMNYPIQHWHICSTKEQMADKIRILLSSPETAYNAVKTFTVQETVQKIMLKFS